MNESIKNAIRALIKEIGWLDWSRVVSALEQLGVSRIQIISVMYDLGIMDEIHSSGAAVRILHYQCGWDFNKLWETFVEYSHPANDPGRILMKLLEDFPSEHPRTLVRLAERKGLGDELIYSALLLHYSTHHQVIALLVSLGWEEERILNIEQHPDMVPIVEKLQRSPWKQPQIKEFLERELKKTLAEV